MTTSDNRKARKLYYAPEQIDVHHGLPLVQALKRVACYGNGGIVEQHGDLKAE
jgi:hypothetical protein